MVCLHICTVIWASHANLIRVKCVHRPSPKLFSVSFTYLCELSHSKWQPSHFDGRQSQRGELVRLSIKRSVRQLICCNQRNECWKKEEEQNNSNRQLRKMAKTQNNDALSHSFSSGRRLRLVRARAFETFLIIFTAVVSSFIRCHFPQQFRSGAFVKLVVVVVAADGCQIHLFYFCCTFHEKRDWNGQKRNETKCRNKMIPVLSSRRLCAALVFMLIIYDDSLSPEHFCDQIASCVCVCFRFVKQIAPQCCRSCCCCCPLFFFLFFFVLSFCRCCCRWIQVKTIVLAGVAMSLCKAMTLFSIYIFHSFSALIFSSPFKNFILCRSFGAAIHVACLQRWLPCIKNRGRF